MQLLYLERALNTVPIILCRRTPAGHLKLVPIVSQFEAKYDFVENFGSKFILQTDHNAPMYKLVVVDLEKPVGFLKY